MTTELLDELRESVVRLLEREISHCPAVEGLATAAQPRPEFWQRAAETGWFRLLLTEERGGMGMSLLHLVALFAEVGRHLAPGPLLDHAVVLPLLAQVAPPAVFERLEPALDGQRSVSFVDAAVDAEPRRRTSAVRHDAGRLDGTVELVRWGETADELVVVADGDDGPVLLVVDRHGPGVEVAPVGSMDPSTRYATVGFRHVAVDNAAIVASNTGSTDDLVDRIRCTVRLMVAAELSGVSRHAFELSLAHARTREQFGRTIGSFQAVKHLLADMFVRVDALTNLCRATAVDASEQPSKLIRGSMAAKAYAAEAARAVTEDALQVHGGIGFTVDYELHLYLKRSLALQGVYGDERELARDLGRLLVRAGENEQGM